MKNLLTICTIFLLLLPLEFVVAQSTNGNGNSQGRENWFPNRGNVGIGTRTPSEALEVLGNVRVSQTVFANDLESVGLKVTTINVLEDAFIGRHLFVSGNVGIGINNPSERLHIDGNLRVSNGIFSDQLTVSQFTATEGIVNNSLNVGQRFIVDGVTGLGVSSPVERLEVSGNIKATQGLYSDLISTGEGSFSRNVQVNQNFIVSGNAGFGVSSPSERLDISGNAKISQGLFSNSVTSGDGLFSRNLRSNQNIIADGSIGIGTDTPSEKLDVIGSIKSSADLLAVNVRADKGYFNTLESDGNLTINGNVGIGVTSPVEKLEVAGNIKATQGLFSDHVNTGSGTFSRSVNITENLLVNGNTGLGVTAPTEKLEVSGNIKSTADVLALNVRADKGYFTSLESNGNLNINGNVGIGVPSPTEKLEVAGNIKATQGLFANSASIAQDLSVGRNVAINGNVGIGTAPGADKLTVDGSAYFNGMLTTENLTVKQKLDLKGTFSVAGTLGVGIATPEATLHVNGDGKFDGDLRANKIIVNAIEIAGATQNPDGGTSLSLGDNLFVNGSVGIGTTKVDGFRLSVDGKIRAGDDIKVYSSAEWSDFVFEEGYKLLTLKQVEDYIKKNGHLPSIPSATEVAKEGVNLVEMDAKLLQKIEELTLYMIEMKKENELLKKEINTLKSSRK